MPAAAAAVLLVAATPPEAAASGRTLAERRKSARNGDGFSRAVVAELMFQPVAEKSAVVARSVGWLLPCRTC